MQRRKKLCIGVRKGPGMLNGKGVGRAGGIVAIHYLQGHCVQ